MAVTTTDIAAALGRPAPSPGSTEEQQWSLWISDALMLIGVRYPDLTVLNQDRLDYVVREAVVAQVRRPDDLTSVDIAVDDGRVSKRYSTSSGRVTIRDEWWDLLATATVRGAWTHDTLAARREGYTWLTPDTWIPLP